MGKLRRASFWGWIIGGLSRLCAIQEWSIHDQIQRSFVPKVAYERSPSTCLHAGVAYARPLPAPLARVACESSIEAPMRDISILLEDFIIWRAGVFSVPNRLDLSIRHRPSSQIPWAALVNNKEKLIAFLKCSLYFFLCTTQTDRKKIYSRYW